MDREFITNTLKKIIYRLLQITVSDEDANLFRSDIHISPVNMVYLLLELENEFPITIDDRFMDELPTITIRHLTDAICTCSD